MSKYLSFTRCFARFNGINRETPETKTIFYMASEDSERISFKHDFFFHWYFTEKPLKDFDFNN